MSRIGTLIRKLRVNRRARKLLDAAFRSPDLLRGTSLAARHASRWVLLDVEAEGGDVVRIAFGILRHPRPYPFSRQSHLVIEHWAYDVRAGKIERTRGVNVTRSEGKDAAD